MRRKDRTDKPAPFGAIVKRQEILDLVIEARIEKKAIRIWQVCQSGYMQCFYLTSKSRFCKPSMRDYNRGKDAAEVNNNYGQWYVTGRSDHSIIGMRKTNSRWFKSEMLMGSYNIESFGGNCHYAFTNKKAAERYSNELKNDKEYLQGVAEWHEECSRMFRSY